MNHCLIRVSKLSKRLVTNCKMNYIHIMFQKTDNGPTASEPLVYRGVWDLTLYPEHWVAQSNNAYLVLQTFLNISLKSHTIPRCWYRCPYFYKWQN